MSKLQTLIATCGKPLLAIGVPPAEVESAKQERRVAWIEIERAMGADRCRITFTGDETPDLVFPAPIPDRLRETIEDASWVKPDDVLAAIGVE